MGSKSKWIGLIILLAVIGAAAVYLLLGGGPQPEPAVLRGYVGGEKIGLLEDEAVQDILERNYGLTLDYAKACLLYTSHGGPVRYEGHHSDRRHRHPRHAAGVPVGGANHRPVRGPGGG